MKLLQRLLTVIICCFVGAVFYMSLVIIERQNVLQKVSRYDTARTATQAMTEFLRLENALARYPSQTSSFEELILRLDIMFSRLIVFEKGPLQEIGEGRSLRQFVRNDPKNEAAIALLRDRLESLDTLIQMQGNDFGVTEALRLITPVAAEMRALSARASAFGAARVAEDKNGLSRLHLIFTCVAYGLIVCGIALIVLLLVQNRALARAHGRLGATSATLGLTHEALALQNQRFNAALNSMSQALCTCNANGQLVVFNERFTELAGHFSIEPGAVLQDVLASPGDGALKSLYQRQMPLIHNHRKGALTVDLPDGRSFSVFHEPLVDGGWLATYADVSERRRAEAELVHMAHHDILTDLPNRVFLRQKLEQEIIATESPEDYVTVFLLDLDRFKEVNDTVGHHFGDELLKCVADRLVNCVGNGEHVARLGGDEFAILVPVSTRSISAINELAHRILKELEEPYAIDGREFKLGASIGIARERRSECTASDLLKHADLAMYQAKSRGKGQVVSFDPSIEIRLNERKSLESDLREAVVRGEMQVFYQPLLDTQTCQVQGYEALLRWKRRHRDFVSPGEFIPIAEETGLINPLGDWALQMACEDAVKWPPHIGVAVNLSPVQFRDGNIVRNTLRALSNSGLSPHRLELEITESVLLDAADSTLETLHQLKQLGVRIVLDDFGTGYSSLSYLSRFPFDKIKIDRAFIGDLTTLSSDTAVVELVVDLGKKLGIRITAEGVETEGQLGRLKELGCTQVQGFLFSPPKSVSEIDFGNVDGMRMLNVV